MLLSRVGYPFHPRIQRKNEAVDYRREFLGGAKLQGKPNPWELHISENGSRSMPGNRREPVRRSMGLQ